MDKQIQTEDSTSSSVLLTGCIFLANLDVTGFVDYAIKAVIGGGIWLAYKMSADYLERKRNRLK